MKHPRIFSTLPYLFSCALGLTIALSGNLAFARIAVSAPTLVPHESEYTMQMTQRTTGSPLSGIDGTMSYLIDDTCDGWSVSQNFSLNYFYNNLKTLKEEKHFTNWEAKDGSSFQFASQNFSNGVIEEALRGTAHKTEDKTGTAVFSAPDDLSFDLNKKTIFPNQYLLNVLKHAHAGKKFYNMVWFDGSDTDGPIEVNTFIGDETKPTLPKDTMNDNINPDLLGHKAWHVRLAFFPLSDPMSTPSYEMDVVLHDNGVVSSTVIHYKNFAITETLQSLKSRTSPDC